MFRIATVFAVVLLGGAVFAGPFSNRHPINRYQCSGTSCTTVAPNVGVPLTRNPPATMQSQESPQEGAPVPEPWLQTLEGEDTFSQRPDTALEPLLGTGSKLPIGGKVPDKVTHQIDDTTLLALKSILKEALTPNKQPVAIALPIEAETSQRLSRISTILEWLLLLGGGYFGLSKAGGLLRLVAQVAAGLPSAMQAASQAQTTTAAATSFGQANQLPVVNQAAPSSTPRPNT